MNNESLVIIGLLVGSIIYTMFLKEQNAVVEKSQVMQQAAQEQTDAYKKNQADLMRQLEQ